MSSSVSGKGISAAVRDSVRTWMTDRVVQLLFDEAVRTNKTTSASLWSFERSLRSASDWVRIKRTRNPKGSGWARLYYSKRFGQNHVGLTVTSNEEDTHIEYVTITLGKTAIGGGRVRVPSVLVSQAGRQTAIKDFEAGSGFAEFTSAELADITAKLEFGEEAFFALLDEERVV